MRLRVHTELTLLSFWRLIWWKTSRQRIRLQLQGSGLVQTD